MSEHPGFELFPLTARQKVATMAASLLGLLLAALDQTIVATAGPEIQRDLHIAPSLYVWITTAYLVASTVMVPVWGKLSDLFGRKRILLAGMTIFLVGSTGCGLAQSTTQLIVMRAVQGLGSAALFTNAFAVIADMFPPADRGKYQGIYGGVFGLASVAGPLAGGFITDGIGWHWVFFINLPIGAIAIAFAAARMPALRRPRRVKVRIDVPGALALSVAVVPLLLALSLGHGAHAQTEGGWAWGSWQILGMFGVSAVGVVAFLYAEGHASDPLLDLRLFGDRLFALGNLATFVMGLSFLSAIVFLPLFMVNVVGLSATNSGLTTMPLTFGIVISNVVVGQMVSIIGRFRSVMLGAEVLLIVAFLIMGFTLATDSTQLGVSIKMFAVGVGLGPAIPLFTLAVQSAVPPHQIGVATSTVTFSRAMGTTIGLAIMGTVFATTLASRLQAGMAAAHGAARELVARQAFTDAISRVYQVCAALAVAGLVVTLLIPDRPLRRTAGAPVAVE
ncbi:MAG: MFS transporter [Myxococcales bacterium]|nr:MFS transporter [Myxococcales bacterium]